MEGLDFSGKALTGHYYDEDEKFANVAAEIRSYTQVYFVVKDSVPTDIRDVLTKKLPDCGRSRWNEFYYRLSSIEERKINAELYKNTIDKYVAFNPLKYIKFGNCSLCDYQIIELALILADLKELEYIDLSGNKLTKKSISNLVSIVRSHPKLKCMYVGGNNFSHKKIARKAMDVVNKFCWDIAN